MADPLLLPAIAVALGILLCRLLDLTIVESAWPIAAFLALTLISWFLGERNPPPAADPPINPLLRKVCLLLAFLFLGSLAESLHRPGPPPEIDSGPREILLLEGCVVEPTILSADRERFTLELAPRARARVSLTLRDSETPQRLDYGQRVEIDARVRRPRNYNNPGAFDYASYLARQDIYWTASMPPGSRARVLSGRCGSRFMSAVFSLRVAALDQIEKLYGPDAYAAAMMEAILIGESSRLEKIWTENFRRTGTFHALVISGVHVTVLAAVLLFLLRLCMFPEIPALAITAAAAWLYALVSGFSAPVVRAAGGFSLYLIARFFFRRTRVMNLLAAVALVYLLFDPAQLADASFQLSFLCVAAIGALAAPILEATSVPYSRGLRDLAGIDLDPHLEPRVAQFRIELRLAAGTISLWTRLPRSWILAALAAAARIFFYSFETAVISTIIQIGLALPMAEYFHRVSFTGLTANILIVPLLNGVVPIGFAAIFTGWHWLAAIASALLKFAAKIAEWHAAREPSWRVPDPPAWIALAFVAALVAVAIVWHRRHRPLLWFAAAATLSLFAILLLHPTAPRLVPGTLELSAIDVGQGDSLLVVFPDSQTMLVDGGGILQFGRPRRTNFDTGEDVVSPYLWSRGIRHLDIIAATHAHEDHSGGISALIENFRPREIWVGSNPQRRLLDTAGRLHIPVLEKHAAPAFDFAGASMQVLSPPEGYASSRPGNNDSLALRIVYAQRSFLLTGDMESLMEARLLDRRIHADVLKVGHHGSKTSTIQPFLDAVSPSIALISVGAENAFGHPNPAVLERLRNRHASILRTDRDGLVTIRTDGYRLWYDTALPHSWSLFNWTQVSGR